MNHGFQFLTDPETKIIFESSDFTDHDCSTVIRITNKSDFRQAFKVKCTRNDIFRIRPSSGILEVDSTAEVTVRFKSTGSEPDSDRHHIGIYHIPAPEGATSAAVWKEHYGPPGAEKRLRFVMVAGEAGLAGGAESGTGLIAPIKKTTTRLVISSLGQFAERIRIVTDFP